MLYCFRSSTLSSVTEESVLIYTTAMALTLASTRWLPVMKYEADASLITNTCGIPASSKPALQY